MDSQTRRYLIEILSKLDCLERDFHVISYKFNQMEINLMALRDDFNQGLADLGTSINDLADRIANLPSADALTQDDVDALKADAVKLKNLAIVAPEIPTGDDTVTPVGTGSATDGNPGQEPVESNPANPGPVTDDGPND